jgi:hypothetical protein
VTETPGFDVAVQIVRDVFPYSGTPTRTEFARIAVAALARAGWLHDPAENAAVRGMIDAAHGIICNAHQKRVDDVTTADGASPGWAKAARRWIDAYPPAALDAAPAGRAIDGEAIRLRTLAQIEAEIDAVRAAEVAALRAVAKVARTYFGRQDPAALDAVDSALAALDAAPVGTTAQLDHAVRLRPAVEGDPSQGPYPASVGEVADEVVAWLREIGQYAHGLGREVLARLRDAAPAGTTAAEDGPCTCGLHGMPHLRGTGQCIYPRTAGEGGLAT